MSFLQKLKKRDIIPPGNAQSPDPTAAAEGQPQAANLQNNHAASEPQGPPPGDLDAAVAQLNIDVFRTTAAVHIVAQIAGSNAKDLVVVLGGDEDVVTIKGQRKRPNGDVFEHAEEDAGKTETLLSECVWGQFYRQVILPAEVDKERAEARMHDGVLVLRLPLKQHLDQGTRLNVVSM